MWEENKQVTNDGRGEANSRQVGGTHYRDVPGEQLWDRILRLYGPGYLIGNILKYVERYYKKDGLRDLEKARHYLDKLIEYEEAQQKSLVAQPPLPSPS